MNAIVSRHDDQQPPAAPDRQHAPEQPHAAVEHRCEDQARQDDQQRLDQQHDQRDRRCHAEPDEGALDLLAHLRVADLVGAGAVDHRHAPRPSRTVRRPSARRSPGSSRLLRMERQAGAARAERSAARSAGCSVADPSSEKVMNSARPPIFSHGTAPAQPLFGEREAAVGRIVAVVAHQEHVVGGHRDGPVIVALRIAAVDRVVRAAVRAASRG